VREREREREKEVARLSEILEFSVFFFENSKNKRSSSPT
jgi:hypothetical protein